MLHKNIGKVFLTHTTKLQLFSFIIKRENYLQINVCKNN